MKKILFLLSIIGYIPLTACSNDDDQTPLEQLPPATQTGKRTFGCLINGKAFIPDKIGQGVPLASYILLNNTYTLGISSVSGRGRNSQLIVLQGVEMINAIKEKEYKLGAEIKNNFSAIYDKGSSGQEGHLFTTTTENKPGTLTITKLDEENGIIAGTFEFTVLDNEGNEIKITDGRFDLPYTN